MSVATLPQSLTDLSDEEKQDRADRLKRAAKQTRRERDHTETAADALIGDAKSTLETETVELDSGLELDVRSRLPASVEENLEALEAAETRGDRVAIRRLNCEMVAAMVVTEEFDQPGVWLAASRDGDAGMQWLSEATATILKPALDRAEETEGKLQPSGNTRGRTGGRPSGRSQRR